jgi:hypothetical protein
MKLVSLIFGILLSVNLNARDAEILGCVDCFNFTAPSIEDASALSGPEMGLLVHETNTDSLKMYGDSGWRSFIMPDPNGNVGVGLGSVTPTQALHVGRTGGSIQLKLERTGSGAGAAFLGGDVNGFHVMRYTGAENASTVATDLTVDEAGSVGIGVIDPTAKLHVNGNIKATSFDPTLNAGDGPQNEVSAVGDTVFFVDTVNSVIGVGTDAPTALLSVNGVAEAADWDVTSDSRLKQNIVGIDSYITSLGAANAEEITNLLNPVTFEWIDPKSDAMNGTQLGFIAQDVEVVVPDAVRLKPDVDQTRVLKINSLIPILVKTIQEQSATIADLKSRVEVLEAQ